MRRLGLAFLLVGGTLLLCLYRTPSPTPSSIRGFKLVDDHNLKKSFFNLKDFKYLIEPESCQGNLSAVLIVTSFAGDVEERSALRRSYPKSELAELGINRVFLLATFKPGQSAVSQKAIEDESRRFGDILQGNFEESYRNLTYKHAMGLRWASENCSDAQFLIKMDSDIVVDLYQVMNLCRRLNFDMVGFLFKGMRPIRLKANKWYVTKSEYPGDTYPPFLSGWMYVTTPKVAASLMSTVVDLPYFWIDDVFITGVAADQLRLNVISINERFTTHPELLTCCIQHRVKCEFMVGPSGGDPSLQIDFQKHSKHCLIGCPSLPKGQMEKKCVVRKRAQTLNKGLPTFKIIKL